MCEPIESEDPVVFISRSAKTRLKIVLHNGSFVPFNCKSGEVQREGFVKKGTGRVKVSWRYSKWIEE